MNDFTYDIATDRLINTIDIINELKKMPSLLFYYGDLKAEAELKFDVLKSKEEEVKSNIYLDLKSTGVKITEKNIEASINVAPKYKKVRDEVLLAKRDLNTMKAYVQCLHAKKDMLIQLSANLRKEV